MDCAGQREPVVEGDGSAQCSAMQCAVSAVGQKRKEGSSSSSSGDGDNSRSNSELSGSNGVSRLETRFWHESEMPRLEIQ